MKSSSPLLFCLACGWAFAAFHAQAVEPTETLSLWPGDAPGEVAADTGPAFAAGPYDEILMWSESSAFDVISMCTYDPVCSGSPVPVHHM